MASLHDGGSERKIKKHGALNPIETANEASNEEFIKHYLMPESVSGCVWQNEWTHPSTRERYALNLVEAGGLSAEDLDACLEMVRVTSGEDYRASSLGWHPGAKRREMKSRELRYILVRDGNGEIRGFASMMPTFENHKPAVYCYEIHLLPELRRTGLGSRLMRYLMTVAENVPSVEKVMLTCFKSNERALRFYEKMGFEVDDFSPSERKLRSGRVLVPDYVVLSWRTRRARLNAAQKE